MRRPVNFKDLRGIIRRWAPALIGIPAMLLLAAWFDVARFFLFGHHLFWIVGAILVIISLSQTPSSAPQKRKGSRSSIKSRQQAEAHKRPVKPKPATTSETPAERLARLRKQKEAVDQKIEKITAKDKERVK